MPPSWPRVPLGRLFMVRCSGGSRESANNMLTEFGVHADNHNLIAVGVLSVVFSLHVSLFLPLCVCVSSCPPSVSVFVWLMLSCVSVVGALAFMFWIFVPVVCSPIVDTTPLGAILERPCSRGQAASSCGVLLVGS